MADKQARHCEPRAKVLGQLLRDGMELQGIGHRELARRLGKPYGFVYKVLAAERRLTALELLDWCRASDLSWRSIMEKLDKLPSEPKHVKAKGR